MLLLLVLLLLLLLLMLLFLFLFLLLIPETWHWVCVVVGGVKSFSCHTQLLSWGVVELGLWQLYSKGFDSLSFLCVLKSGTPHRHTHTYTLERLCSQVPQLKCIKNYKFVWCSFCNTSCDFCFHVMWLQIALLKLLLISPFFVFYTRYLVSIKNLSGWQIHPFINWHLFNTCAPLFYQITVGGKQ